MSDNYSTDRGYRVSRALGITAMLAGFGVMASVMSIAIFGRFLMYWDLGWDLKTRIYAVVIGSICCSLLVVCGYLMADFSKKKSKETQASTSKNLGTRNRLLIHVGQDK